MGLSVKCVLNERLRLKISSQSDIQWYFANYKNFGWNIFFRFKLQFVINVSNMVINPFKTNIIPKMFVIQSVWVDKKHKYVEYTSNYIKWCN